MKREREKSEFDEDVKEALKVLKEGGVILYPTDTVWGIGCDATNKEALKKLFSIKQRESGKGTIILLDNFNSVKYYVKDVPEIAFDISDLSEKPVTIIYSDSLGLPEEILATDGSLGIRIVRDEFCNKLIRQFKRPITSTSANFTGIKTPSCFAEIDSVLKEKVDYIVKYRQHDLPSEKPSSIIKIDNSNRIKIIRE